MTVKLTINGIQVSAHDGSTILEAARQQASASLPCAIILT